MNTSSFIYKNSLCNTTNGTVNDSANEVVDSEIWKDIEGYEGLYQVSNLGRVKSLNYHRTGKEKILRLEKSQGYYIADLCINGKAKHYKVHRLVAEAFIPNPENLPEINHKDENPSNNNVNNLEYCDRKYNNSYGSRNERSKQKQINDINKSVPIVQIDLNNDTVAIWPSMAEAQRNGFNLGNIYLCCNGRQNTHKGYKWIYYEDFLRLSQVS